MAGLRHISHPLAVPSTSDHLRGRLLEDLGGHSSPGKGRCRSSSKQNNDQGTGRWNKCRNRNIRDGKRGNVEGWEPKSWSGRERSGDGWSKRTWSKRESARINVSVQGTNKRCENDDLHHSLLHRLLDAAVYRRHALENSKANQVFFCDSLAYRASYEKLSCRKVTMRLLRGSVLAKI